MEHHSVPAYDLYLDDDHAVLEWAASDGSALRAAFGRDATTLTLAQIETRTRPPQPLDAGAEVVPDELLRMLQRRGFEVVDGTRTPRETAGDEDAADADADEADPEPSPPPRAAEDGGREPVEEADEEDPDAAFRRLAGEGE